MLQLSKNVNLLEFTADLFGGVFAPDFVEIDHFAYKLPLGNFVFGKIDHSFSPMAEATGCQLVFVREKLDRISMPKSMLTTWTNMGFFDLETGQGNLRRRLFLIKTNDQYGRITITSPSCRRWPEDISGPTPTRLSLTYVPLKDFLSLT